MKKTLSLIAILGIAISARSQQVDSIFFHLYTDSLKKGQHNYINVDGKFSDGRWQPLTARELDFSCATAEFKGNELFIPADFNQEKVVVKARLKTNPSVSIERTIWIKKLPDPAVLPTKEEILEQERKKEKSKNKDA